MKGILKFNLPEEKEEFLHAQNGIKYKACIEDIENYFRTEIKYKSDMYTEVEINLLESVRQSIFDIIRDRDIY